MNAPILMLAVLGLVACGNAPATGQVNLNTPNSFININMRKEAKKDPSYTVNIDTDAAYDDCMKKFQDIPSGPGTCQEEADRAKAEALATAGAVIGVPLGQGANMAPNGSIQQGYFQAQMACQQTSWGACLPMPPPMPMQIGPAAPQQPAPTGTDEKTEKVVQGLVRAVQDHEGRLTQIEGGK